MHDYQWFPFHNMPFGLGWVVMLLFWGLVIAGIVALFARVGTMSVLP